MYTIAKFGLTLTALSLISFSAHAQVYDAVLKIDNPGGGAGDVFGNSMAAVGDKLPVSAYRDDTGAKDAGAVYLFSAPNKTRHCEWSLARIRNRQIRVSSMSSVIRASTRLDGSGTPYCKWSTSKNDLSSMEMIDFLPTTKDWIRMA